MREDSSTSFKDGILSTFSRAEYPNQESVILRYYQGIDKARRLIENQEDLSPKKTFFQPPFALPALSEKWVDFYDPARMDLINLGTYKSRTLRFLNLMQDPSTQTTKTVPSLSIVARAVDHIHKTGENILLLVTTSGNKGTALRSAVQRAIQIGLVDRKQLRIAMLAPVSSATKMRCSDLSNDPELARLNPLALYTGNKGNAYVKEIGNAFASKYTQEFFKQSHTRIWYTLNLNNYRIEDSVRAFFEHEASLLDQKRPYEKKLQVHAVSSAFGIIGFNLGRSILRQENITSHEPESGYMIVQDMGNPDMVLFHHFGSFCQKNMPRYQLNNLTGLYTQNESLHFPEKTFSPNETLDSTFYTRQPVTASYVSKMIKTCGGSGIVVSLQECLEKYAFIRYLLAPQQILLPEDPRKVHEWAIIMAFTGVLKAIDRGLIDKDTLITVHGSGLYTEGDYTPIPTNKLPNISDDKPVEALRNLLI